ncbi:MAG: ABC transporter ATP-binding protein [Spartobacteria bacterium]|nr:ABC transporter ATP-binding protein [Spartobacteria bacterium]
MNTPDIPPRLYRYILRYWKMLLAGFLMSFVAVSFNTCIPFLSRYIIDALTGARISGARLLAYLGLYLAAASGSAFFSYWMRFIPLRIGHRVEADVRRDLFAHCTDMEPAFFRRYHTGDLIVRLSADMQTMAMSVGQGFMQICRMTFVLLLAFGVMFSISVNLTLCIMALVPLMTLTFVWLSKRTKRGHIAVHEQLSEMSTFTQETFTGIQSVKAFSMEGRWADFFEELNNTLMGRNIKLARVHDAIWPVAAFWFSLGSAMILLVGGRLVIREQMTLGELVQFNQYLLYMQWPLLSLGWILTLIQRGHASWRRIRDVLRCPPAIRDAAQTVPTLRHVAGDIRFHQVSLEENGARLIDHISFTACAGSRVGITGPVGSGKTLLVSMLPRLLEPTEGEITIGGINIQAYPLAVLRGHIGMAEQEPTLFSQTLSENIAFGLADFSNEKVLQAADIAHLCGDVEALPDHYETMIGEKGVRLSGGQRQRTSISRAITREPAVLILDDVLSAVDTETEAAILKKLKPVFEARTTFFVSHRISTLRDMDLILVMEEGRISQQGTHQDLLAEKGYYQRMSDIQELAHRVE